MNRRIFSFFKARFKRKYLKPQTLVLNKKVFYLPRFSSGEYFNQRMSELWMIDLLKNYLSIESGVFIDVGANVGQTLLKLRAVNSMRYIGFEPNSDCVSYLHQLIRANKFCKAEVVPVGISDQNALVNLNIYSGPLDSSASIIEGIDHRQVWEKRLIPVLNLETISNQYHFDFVSVLKIDVEGSELEVIRSFKNIIIKDQPWILVEVLPPGDDLKKNKRKEELYKLINELKYQIFHIEKTSDKVLKLDQIENFNNIIFNETDFLLIPSTGKSLRMDVTSS